MVLVVGFSRAKSKYKVLSTAIQAINNRDYSHCYLRYECLTTGVPLIAQASHGYVNLVSLEIFKQDNVIVKEYILTVPEHKVIELFTFICKSLGTPYSKTQLLLLMIKELLHFQIPSYNKDKYYICSEYAARICAFLGVPVPEYLDYVRPTDMDKILENAGVPLNA